MEVGFILDGRAVEVPDTGDSLLEVLRQRLGVRTAKDGCSPQGQCGCCTVWVDGTPRVACVTPARRVAGRNVTTLGGLDADRRRAWAEAFAATGASQCGYCTPGIIMRLAGLETRRELDDDAVSRALLAHQCRCTGWQTILEAARVISPGHSSIPAESRPGAPPPVTLTGGCARRDLGAAARRATIEGGSPQQVGLAVVLGQGGFADDTAPPDALVAVFDGKGDWTVAETLAEARARAGKVQGRRSTVGLHYPLEVPPGVWDLCLRTTWVEPAYLETDASWCRPGGEPSSPLANGGAFGAKMSSAAPAAARRLADELGRTVRVVLSREDVVRTGPKRPPMAAGIRRDGTGIMRVGRTPGIAAAVAQVAPGLLVEEDEVVGPPTSAQIRGAGWAEAAVLAAVASRLDDGTGPIRVVGPSGGHAEAWVADDWLRVRVSCGDPLDEVVLRSYCIGAAHMAMGWVRSEGIAVDPVSGAPQDLTIRSFGILGASQMSPVEVEVVDEGGPPVNGSDAVLAAVAAGVWMHDGLPVEWPTTRTEKR
ncbi:MAG: hypothetical protein DLM54_04150 [Acidimicrobiales bacterium]|nr:MAG: hypothetical protein DLM54_04150 [Acidimicrobiales bacterium]